MNGRRAARRIERLLMVVAFACLGWYGFAKLDAGLHQRQQESAFERLRELHQRAPDAPASARAESSASFGAASPVAPVLGDLVGMLTIPRLSMSTPVVVGDDRGTLRGAAGLLPDSRHPWDVGNSAIAAHRDGLFRPLKNIRVGDEVVLRTTRGDLRYRVRDTKIVMPDDLSVLAQTDTHTLTLITCFPFNYLGSAPKRFIVHADRVIDSPSPVIATTAGNARSGKAGKSSRSGKARRLATAGRSGKAGKNLRAYQAQQPYQPHQPSLEPTVEKKRENRLLRGLRAFGRAFKPRQTSRPSH